MQVLWLVASSIHLVAFDSCCYAALWLFHYRCLGVLFFWNGGRVKEMFVEWDKVLAKETRGLFC